MSDGFVDVKQSSAIWEPKQTGSKKGGDLTSLVASDKSYMIGYYLTTRDGLGEKNNSTIHDFQLEGAGSKNAIPEGVNKGDKISIWGTGVLNSLIAENVQPGEYVKVQWMGIQEPKKAGGNSYHFWKVLRNPEKEPLDLGGNIAVPAKNVPNETTDQSPDTQGDNDDMPF